MKNIINTTLDIPDPNTSTGYREATLEKIMTTARQALKRKIDRGTALTSPRVTADYLVARLVELPHEVFTMIYLDLCGEVINVQCRVGTAVRTGFSAI